MFIFDNPNVHKNLNLIGFGLITKPVIGYHRLDIYSNNPDLGNFLILNLRYQFLVRVAFSGFFYPPFFFLALLTSGIKSFFLFLIKSEFECINYRHLYFYIVYLFKQ